MADDKLMPEEGDDKPIVPTPGHIPITRTDASAANLRTDAIQVVPVDAAPPSPQSAPPVDAGAEEGDSTAVPPAPAVPVPEATPPPQQYVPFEQRDGDDLETAKTHFLHHMQALTLGLSGEILVEVRIPDAPQRYGGPKCEFGYFLISAECRTWAKLWAWVEVVLKRGPKLRPTGVYVTINPLLRDLLAHANHALVVAKRSVGSTPAGGAGTSASDEHVTRRRFLPVDIDPVRRAGPVVLKGVCATAAEKAAAQAVMTAVRADLTARGWPQPMLVVDSGNGFALWYAIDLPADDGGLVARALKALAAAHNTADASIDPAVANASRIMRLAGTFNGKGADAPEVDRPHRMCRLLAVLPERRDVPVSLIEALAAEYQNPKQAPKVPTIAPKAKPKTSGGAVRPASTPLPPRSGGTGDAVRRCRAYMKSVNPAVQGDHGSDDTIRAARIIWNDFGLDDADGFSIFCEWNETCSPPWEMDGSQGLRRKWDEAVAKGQGPEGRGYKLRDDRPPPPAAGGTAPLAPAPADPLPTEAEPAAAAEADAGDVLAKADAAAALADALALEQLIPETNPHKLARGYLRSIDPDEKRLLRYWHGMFWQWGYGAYREVPRDDFRAKLVFWLAGEMRRLWMDRYREWKKLDPATSGDPPEETPVTKSMLDNVVLALGGERILDAATEAPAWIDSQSGPDPVSILPLRNGLLDLAAAADEKPDCLLEPNPSFFTLNAAPFDYTLDTAEPTEWLNFLAQIWPNDGESIGTLQEWFGLLLTPDTTHQKMLLLLGPPRSGKGTIARILTALVGAANVAGPTLNGLAGEFGLSPLLGRSVAIISDARLSARTDTATVTERLLAISGEDSITVNRKGISMLTVKLPTRFVIISNELPQLGDASGALANRMILLRLTKTFLGREDKALSRRLVKNELPAILRWAIAGWRRLQERGRLSQPTSGRPLMMAMTDLSSPTGQFVRERCLLGTGVEFQVAVSDLYHAWQNWCSSKGRKEPGTDEVFGRNLRAAFSEIEKTRPRVGEKRIPTYTGIRLRKASDPDPEDADTGTAAGHSNDRSAVTAPGTAQTPEIPGPVTAVIANTHSLASRAREDEVALTQRATVTAMRGHSDHHDQNDSAKMPTPEPSAGRFAWMDAFDPD